MNSTDTETVADVLAEMRDAATSAEAWHASMDANVVTDFADRVEIAARRERDHAIEHATHHAEAVARDNCRDCVHNPRGKNYEGGNEAAMREAAVSVYYSLEKLRPFSLHLDDVGRMREFNHLICLAKNRLDAALSAPARNCDVGTADEQIARFNEFCDSEWQDSGSANCGNCPLWVSGRIGHDCQIRWEQRPYEAQGGGVE